MLATDDDALDGRSQPTGRDRMNELIPIPLKRLEQSFFWSAPVNDSEFTAEDPLALDYVAQQVGLMLLPTLTTRSSRAQAYAMVLYGLHLAGRALEVYGLPDDDEMRRRLFERWERFWALATLESRNGRVERGDPDAMRGVRGAKRAWFDGDKALPLDFPLISRQLELGSLGAYLSPLRLSRLVIPGSLRLSAAADEIVKAFWGEPAEGARSGWYEEYALQALDLGRQKIDRSHRNLTLRKVGERSRLTSLVGKSGRPAQQARLYDALVTSSRDATTVPISQLVEASTRDGVHASRAVLDGALASRWGRHDTHLVELLTLARRFGDVMDHVLRLFDRVYAALSQAGWQAPRARIAANALPEPALNELRRVISLLLESPQLQRLRGLPAHGNSFVRFLEGASEASADHVVELLLALHLRVQKERRRGEAWMGDQGGTLTLHLTTFTARPETDRFPGLKIGVLRQLLVDCGRLPQSFTEPGPSSGDDGAA
jgi:hypothetical protein